MGLFKKKKPQSTQDKLVEAGKLNRQQKHIDQSIRTLEQQLTTAKQKADAAKAANNTIKAQAELATINLLEKRLVTLYESLNALKTFTTQQDNESALKPLLASLQKVEDTLPKKKKKNAQPTQLTLSEVNTYIEDLLTEATNDLNGDPNQVTKDELDAFFDQSARHK